MYGCVSLANNRWKKQSCIKGRPDSLEKIPLSRVLNGKYYHFCELSSVYRNVALYMPKSGFDPKHFTHFFTLKVTF
jgi:hypothetical protein